MFTRFVKVMRDLRADAGKNAILAAAIGVGVLSVGTILGAWAVLTREMARNYLGTNPAHATLKVEGALQPEHVARVRRVEGVADAERHATVLARMRIGSDWYPILLFVVDDFRDIRTNRFTRVSGVWPPPTGTMLIERTARVTTKSDQGGSVIVRTPRGQARSVAVSGLVHDPGLAPAWQEQQGYGYITVETLQWLGEKPLLDELRVTLADGRASAVEIEVAGRRISEVLRSEGLAVHELQVPPPRRHPHQGQMQAILRLFLIFSFATLILGAILVATSLATLMARQLREIGVMKAVGARSGQIASLYLLTQTIIAGAAVVVAVPLSEHTAAQMIGKVSTLLNLNVVDASIPLWVSVVQAAAGLLIPLAAAAVPVWRGSAMTVRDALASHGVSATRFGSGPVERLVSRLAIFGPSGRLAVRNVFRQRGRLLMAITLLAAGGALFMTALNVSRAWSANLEKIERFRHYDVEIRLAEAIAARRVDALRGIAGVKSVEGWSHYPAAFASGVPYDIVSTYPDKGHGSFVVQGAPRDTRLVGFPLLGGRWVRAGHAEIVLNHMARPKAGNLRLGDRVRLNIDGRATEWTLVGFVEDLGSTGATAYVPADVLARSLGKGAIAPNMIRVALNDRGADSVLRATREIERELERDASISMSLPMTLIRSAIGEHMAVLVSSLLALSLLMALVGTFGLASTMSMNVLERTRELGVMRAIGATPSLIARTLIAEGMAISAMSFLFAATSSAALSLFMSGLIGNMSFRTPLPLRISGPGVAVWVGILVAGSVLATAIPARRASRLTVRDALADA